MSLLNHHAQRQSQDMAPRGAQPPTQVFNAGAEKSNSVQQVLRGTQHSQARASVRLTRLGELAQSLHLPPAHWTQGSQTSCHLQASTAQPLREHRPGRAHENAHRYSIKPFRNFYLHPLEFSKTPAADPKLRRGDRTRSSPTLAQHFPAMSETIRGFPAPDFLDIHNKSLGGREPKSRTRFSISFCQCAARLAISARCLARLILGVQDDGVFSPNTRVFQQDDGRTTNLEISCPSSTKSGCSAHPAVGPPAAPIAPPSPRTSWESGRDDGCGLAVADLMRLVPHQFHIPVEIMAVPPTCLVDEGVVRCALSWPPRHPVPSPPAGWRAVARHGLLTYSVGLGAEGRIAGVLS